MKSKIDPNKKISQIEKAQSPEERENKKKELINGFKQRVNSLGRNSSSENIDKGKYKNILI